MILRFIFFLATIFFLHENNLAQYVGQHPDLIKSGIKAPVKAYAFDLQDIRLLNSRFSENMEREQHWLLALPNDRLLHSFNINAGLSSNNNLNKTGLNEPLGGWEALDMEVRGHSMGHFLSGLALQYASTGDIRFKNKGDSLVAELAKVQRALNQNGYLGAFPQNYIDRNINGLSVWAPWYTLHKIFAGLNDMYLLTGNKQALEIESGMASWAYNKLSALPEDTLERMQKNEVGGMSETLYNLYSITNDPKHLQLAEMFYHHAVLDPLMQKEDKLNHIHANTTIPKIIGEARGYELTGDSSKYEVTHFFWDDIIKNHTYANGGNSDKELFFEPGKISEHITGNTTETCNTYNMLKLTRHLFTWNADEKYAEYYEQALYNHILGQQDPQSGMVGYYMPMKPGAYRIYSSFDNSFWCCVGTGFESHSKYGEAIYYHDDKGVFINLFIPSELNWKEKGFTLLQETAFPRESKSSFTIKQTNGENISLYMRYPAWATSGATLKINGRKLVINNKPGSYITITRKWKANDKIEVNFPMSLRWAPTPDNPAKAAIAYGPILLAGAMGTEGMTAPAPFLDNSDPFLYFDYDFHIPADIEHTLHAGNKKLNEILKPVAGKPLTFVTAEGVTAKPIQLKPSYDMHHERYVVYWDLE
ncbi:MAG: beta-L-arabinofuranosidase domain-containing protein [Flavitalea sp.]